MKKTLALSALLVLAACSNNPADLLAKARESYASHDFTAARLHLAEALKAEPGNREMLLLQARNLIALGDGDGAGTALEKLAAGKAPQGEIAELSAEAALLRRKPDLATGYLTGIATVEADRLRAMAAMQKSDLPGAEQALARAIAAGGSARAFADMARLHMLKGDLVAASAMSARAEAADKDGISPLLTGAEIAARKGDLQAALTRYERAEKLYPGNIPAMIGRTASLGELGRFDDMEAALDPLAKAVPQDPSVSYLRARLALARKDWTQVRELIQPIETTLDAQDPKRLIYAEALLRLGQAEQARAQVAGIARANPNNRLAVRLLAESLLAAGDAKAAAAALRPIATSPQARPEEVALMAKIAKAAGDPDAGQIAQRAQAPSPQALAADVAEGDAAMRASNWARAVTAYDRILAVTDGRNAIVLNNMAFAQSMLGNHAKARDFADRALKLAGENASVLDTAGFVRLRAGQDLGEAKRLLGKAAQLAPQNAAIKAHLAEVNRTAG